MKTFCGLLVACGILVGCGSSQNQSNGPDQNSAQEVVEISNDSLDFKLLVFEPRFDSWLSMQDPMESFKLGYLERRNRFYADEYNRRVLDPNPKYGNLYPHRINYDPRLDYGLELNYMLYMYFKFFQENYRQDL